MKKIIALFALAAALPLVTPAFAEEETAKLAAESVLKEGVQAGVWTQDFAAAQKEAAAKKLPVLMNFTGSDWCGWCKLADKNIFSTDEWKKYAAEKLVLAWIDFPKDKSKVPEAFQKRNEELSKKYDVHGYPTFIMLDSDGNELFRASTGRSSASEFIKQLDDEFAKADKIAKLSGDKKAAYDKAKQDLKEANEAFKKFIKEANSKAEELHKKVEAAEKALEAVLGD